MGTIVVFLMVSTSIGALSLDSLQGKWTASVRLDNLFRVNTYFNASVYSDDYYDDAWASANLYSGHSASFGFPTEYSILWRIKKDLAVGLDGRVSYQKTPEGRYERIWDDRREEAKYEGSYWDGSLALEFYKYFKKEKFISPFLTLSPFLTQSRSERIEDGTGYSLSDTTSYRGTITSQNKRYGVNLNYGVEVFFRLFNAQMGMRMKSTLIKFWRYWHEYSVDTKEDGDRGYEYTREENPFGVNFYLPTKGNFSLWLCFYF